MLGIREKIAYGLGDTASNFIFQTVMLFLTYFYTDIFGISPAVVGGLFLFVRIIDAVTDPLMGFITDRTHTRFGSYRPYLLWLAVPFGLVSVITFTTPDLSDTGKVWYAYATYTLLMLAYTAINIPYSALGGVLSADPKQRVSIQSYRFVFGMLGGLLISACTLPMVEYFGHGDKAIGYQRTMMVMSVLGVFLFLVCFFGTQERVNVAPTPGLSLKRSGQLLWQNTPFKLLCVVAVFLLTGMVLKTTLAIYYIKYYLGREDLITQFITLGMVGNILGCALAHSLAKRVEKVKAYQGLQWLSALLTIIAFWAPADNIVLCFGLYFLWCFSLQMATPLLWAKMADVVDYGHFHTGVRLTGIVYSSIVFFIKLGLAIGGALAGILLAYFDYQAGSTVMAHTKTGIVLSFTLLPALTNVVVALVMNRYSLDNQRVADIHRHLHQHSNDNVASPSAATQLGSVQG